MRVILTGGGTGGHIYPAIAIGQAIREMWSDTEFLYVGTNRGLEKQIVPQAGFAFRTLEVIGWQRKVSWQALEAGWKAVGGMFQAARLVREFSPDLVIGTGGYVCLPVVWAAVRQGIPTIIHEQNAMPGLTNKFLSRKATAIMLTFKESALHFPSSAQGKIRVTGLPIRPAILNVSRAEGLKFLGFSPEKPVLLIVGGSRGARSINSAMIGVYGKAQEMGVKLQVIHLTGTLGLAQVQEELVTSGIDLANCGNIIIRPYLHEMEYALACADLCVGRSGAAFLSEMTAKGIPGILIPYPYATENHQEHNARSLADQGAAEVILDHELTAVKLAELVFAILEDSDKRKDMANRSLQAGKPDAIEKIIQVIKKTVSKY